MNTLKVPSSKYSFSVHLFKGTKTFPVLCYYVVWNYVCYCYIHMSCYKQIQHKNYGGGYIITGGFTVACVNLVLHISNDIQYY